MCLLEIWPDLKLIFFFFVEWMWFVIASDVIRLRSSSLHLVSSSFKRFLFPPLQIHKCLTAICFHLNSLITTSWESAHRGSAAAAAGTWAVSKTNSQGPRSTQAELAWNKAQCTRQVTSTHHVTSGHVSVWAQIASRSVSCGRSTNTHGRSSGMDSNLTLNNTPILKVQFWPLCHPDRSSQFQAFLLAYHASIWPSAGHDASVTHSF